MRIRVITFAKINLYLDVIGKYSNGYHQIESVFQSIGLSDELILEDSRKGVFFISNEKSLPTDERNLVIKAANILATNFGVKKGVKIYLEKRIPIGRGLGGGSSNCAGTLAGLNVLWGLGLSKEELIKFATKLGADVPFFFTGGTCAVSGIGDFVRKLPFMCDYYIVLIDPGFSSSTREVYTHPSLVVRRIRKKRSFFSYNFRKMLVELYRKRWEKVLYNRLEIPAFVLYPKLRKIKDFVNSLGVKNVCMTGSGSTIFAIFGSKDEAELLAKKISDEYNEYGVYIVEPVSCGFKLLEDCN
ncbi:MAG: 4-(cytidine 5'-diphospho)-2-C-methyl-D-erythritol kinase [Candidatus Hydrogenedentes bacterium]|nr:4-(cytidine 5'-diphospho)-2-C-methyl-D-erythritol kinase [Candidatus Hydrogenedentota bacterium]